MSFSAVRLFALVAIGLLTLLPGGRAQTTVTLTTLHVFGATNTDAFQPIGLVQGKDGNFYGATFEGGSNQTGTVFKLTPAGALSILHNFGAYDANHNNVDGVNPQAALVQGRDGNFYGTTVNGGSSDAGTVFQVTPTGGFAVLHDFSGVSKDPFENIDGANPQASLVQGTDGNFYGTTQIGGSLGGGTAFQITPTGGFAVLHNFTGAYVSAENSDGTSPIDALIQGSDGNFYGTAQFGGWGSRGTVFQITPTGGFTTLHDFASEDDGSYPQGALVEGRDGNFYGTTFSNRAGTGTIFQVTPTGGFATLHSFSALTHYYYNADGSQPTAGLTLGQDGNFYGVAPFGGSDGQGTLFQITPTGGFTTLYDFTDREDGANPNAALIQDRDGYFYGTTTRNNSAGTAFKLAVGPVITSPATATATPGQAFSYRVAATGNPTKFGVQGLPAYLSVNTATGVISGTPTAAGTVNLTLNAYNRFGKGSTALALTIGPPAPVVTSATAATATQGSAFSYQITATNQPTSFGVQGLPAGLSVDTKTGLVSGMFKGAGKVTLTLNAYNAGGKGSATLTLTIKAAAPAAFVFQVGMTVPSRP